MTFCVPCSPVAQIEGCPGSWAALCSLLNLERERVVEEMPGGSQESEWFMSAGMLGEDNSTLKSEGPAVSSDLLLRQITKWVRRRRGEPPFKTNHFLCIPTWCVYHDMPAWCYFGRKKKVIVLFSPEAVLPFVGRLHEVLGSTRVIVSRNILLWFFVSEPSFLYFSFLFQTFGVKLLFLWLRSSEKKKKTSSGKHV